MTEIPLISFIIPVYNTSIDKLNRCLNSISQIRKLEFEIILVNDGSEQEYTQQYLKCISKYSNLTYIYESNTGVSSARNKGISASRGKYIFFVDSDDIIDSSAFTSKLKKIQSDLIIFNVTIKTTKKIKEYSLNYNEITEVPKNILLETSIKNGLINWSVGKLYKRTILQQSSIRFDKHQKAGEDLEFVVKFIVKSKTIKYLPLNSYYYYLSKETAYLRFSKYPLQMIDDALTTYNYRKNVISKIYSGDKEKENIRISEEVVQTLFNVYILQQNASMEIYNRITEVVNKMPYKNNFNLVNKIRVYILYSNNKFLLKIYKLLFKVHRELTKDR